MQTYRKRFGASRLSEFTMGVILAVVTAGVLPVAKAGQDPKLKQQLTPLQLEIEKQRQRLGAFESEDRREAVAQLGSMHHPEASRVALSALSDPSPIVRATAASAVLYLPLEESVGSLLPLLADKDEFVRQQVAYALGETRSRAAVPGLIQSLADKEDSVRGSAAVALGQIADRAALSSLAAVLMPSPELPVKKKKKSKVEQNPFVLRAAAHSLGQIGDRAGAPALIFVLQDEKA
jgi:HEAT repeat protein